VKLTSKDLYRELKAGLAPAMKAEGFAPLKGATPGWKRRGVAAGFQADKWGWTERWGSRFTVNFDAEGGRSERIGYLLEGFPELDELRVRSNAVIARLPRGSDPPFEEYKIDPEKAVYGRDIWLNYHSLDDVREWAAYFAAKLPRFVSLFENETRSPEGEAAQRFHRAMARVQGAREPREKAAILEAYARSESDAHYRAGAERWLGELRKLA
jgi:hypothetical protein